MAYRMALRVIPMGDVNAVDVANEVHREILRKAGCLSGDDELVYGTSFPGDPSLKVCTLTIISSLRSPRNMSCPPPMVMTVILSMHLTVHTLRPTFLEQWKRGSGSPEWQPQAARDMGIPRSLCSALKWTTNQDWWRRH